MRHGVSIIIPNRNHGDFIGAALSSAANESPLEVLILDDDSTDNSIEIIQQVCSIHNNFRYIKYPTKSPDWIKDACSYMLTLNGQHVISLAADDELCNGCIMSATKYPDAPIIFHSYAVRKVNQAPYHIIRTPFINEISLTKDQICNNFLSNLAPMETGIGSLVRYDWQKWLIDHEFYKMGPYCDAMGYAAVAAFAGATYIPKVGAIFTQQENSYGEINRRSDKNEYFKNEVINFFNRIGMRKDIAKSLMMKRGI